MFSRPDDQPLHGAGRQRAEAADHAPYQIYAVKAIVDCIHQNWGNGYIWHTTGSGRTSPPSRLPPAQGQSGHRKCLFVVDRKDLDRQTRLEFNKFQEGCVEETRTPKPWCVALLSEDYADKVIVTTIQKLGLALDETSKRPSSTGRKASAPTRSGWPAARPAYRHHFRRMPPLPSSARTTRPSRTSSPRRNCSVLPARPSSGRTPAISKSTAPSVPTAPPRTSSKSSCTPPPSPTPLMTATCCVFISTISSPRGSAGRGRLHPPTARPKRPPLSPARPSRSKPWWRRFCKHDAATNQRRFNALLATLPSTTPLPTTACSSKYRPNDWGETRTSCRSISLASSRRRRRATSRCEAVAGGSAPEKADNQQEPEQKKAALSR